MTVFSVFPQKRKGNIHIMHHDNSLKGENIQQNELGKIIPHQKYCCYCGMGIKEFLRGGILLRKGENLKQIKETQGWDDD